MSIPLIRWSATTHDVAASMSVAVNAAACPAVLVSVMPESGRTGVLDIPDPGGGLAGELGEIAGLAAERALHAVGETGVSPVEHLAEELLLDFFVDGLAQRTARRPR